MPSGPDASQLLVTTSWDDGHPSDLRLADLLAKHGAAGTFYVPNWNSEGRLVMRPSEIRRIGQHLEVGGHTRDHVILTALAPNAASRQIVANKDWLEDLLGRELVCFAYVRGKHNRTVRRLVREAGFRYARTVTNLWQRPGPDRCRVATTMQFFPHSDDVYLRNFLSGGPGLRRMAMLRAVLGTRGMRDRLNRVAERCTGRGGCLHIWGHSWELDEYGLWDELDRYLAHLRELGARFVTNEASWTHAAAPEMAAAEIVP